MKSRYKQNFKFGDKVMLKGRRVPVRAIVLQNYLIFIDIKKYIIAIHNKKTDGFIFTECLAHQLERGWK